MIRYILFLFAVLSVIGLFVWFYLRENVIGMISISAIPFLFFMYKFLKKRFQKVYIPYERTTFEELPDDTSEYFQTIMAHNISNHSVEEKPLKSDEVDMIFYEKKMGKNRAELYFLLYTPLALHSQNGIAVQSMIDEKVNVVVYYDHTEFPIMVMEIDEQFFSCDIIMCRADVYQQYFKSKLFQNKLVHLNQNING
ncbi:hypothetical protein [Salirhabdus salicampi]|uniref:hypothetical protein n=1 Tax=Salirhabdus salicampi TaxID=476102 RepID=UPI0020C4205D|nr:hypothetical protein [Salirhabdus salicampi]MCP8615742.1 hypothetical protein [Salirhabdus salicampi]